MVQRLSAIAFLLVLSCSLDLSAQTAPATRPTSRPTSRPATSPATQPARKYDRATGIELARPGTLKQYIDRYEGKDVGCTIGGQTFRNFKLRTQSSVDTSQFDGPHPLPPMDPDQIFVTPVNYVKDGRRWIGFRWTNTPDSLTILGGDKNPPDFPFKKGHDIKNAGFTTNYDVRFEVYGTSNWERGKVAYANLFTDCFVDGQWSEAKNTGPGSRGNLGWFPRKIGEYGSYSGINPKTPQSNAWARLSSISRAFNAGSKAPTSNDNWFFFVPEKAPKSFEVRAGQWPDYEANDGKNAPHLYSYGMWFRMNCWGRTQTRWKADYVEFAFSNPSLTDEIWTADGTNKAAAPAPLPVAKEPLPAEPLPVAKPTNEALTLDLGEGVQLKLVKIPAGKFIMGSPNDEKGRCDNEGPQRVVTISKSYYMGVTEVTQKQLKAIIGGTGGKFAGDDRPVDLLSFRSAVKFCQQLSQKSGKTVRLPTEAEWEYAARAGTTTCYSFGDDEKSFDEYAVAWPGSGGRETTAVAQKKPNAWGLYDMHGNVWEWCSDLYSPNYVDAATQDPTGPKTGDCPVLRGGSWAYPGEYARSASRLIGSPNDIADGGTVGFRIVVEDQQP